MEFLRKNINLKILALVFAVLMWGYVSFTQNPSEERSFQLKVKPIGSPAAGYLLTNKIITGQNDVIVRAPRMILDKVKSVYVMPSVQDAKSDVVQKVRPAAYDIFGNPVKNLDIVPNYISVIVYIRTNFVAKTVPVETQVTGSVKKGYAIESIKIDPMFVAIQAPENVEIDKLLTEKININLLDKDFKTETNLETPGGVTVLNYKKIKIEIHVKPVK